MVSYTYKFRLYPTKSQEELLNKHFEACRFVYNYFLADRKSSYDDNKVSKNYYEQAAELTKLKKEKDKEWMKEVCAQSLQYSLKNLDAAYQNFFNKRAKFPNFKKKNSKQSYTVPQGVKVEDNRLIIRKFQEGIKIRLHRPIEGLIKKATISKNSVGHYYVAILVERDIEHKPKLDNEIGIDLGIAALATTNDGKIYPNMRPLKTYEDRIAESQQKLSRQVKGSNNWKKTKHKIAKLHLKVANIRKDYLHKVSHSIVSENQVIFMEGLDVKGMIENGTTSLSKNLSDVALGELIRQIKYKSGWYGRTFVQIGQYYPSSKSCFECGFVHEVKLKDREWTCPNCQSILQRDLNAAKNILKEGKRIWSG